MKAKITPKEQSLLSFIESYQLKNGGSPTVREMREHMDLKSDGFVIHCLKRLAAKGFIKKNSGAKRVSRGVKMLQAVSEKLHAGFVKIPLLGSIPAGGPVVSEENVEDWITFGNDRIKNPKDCFILRVRGDSMINAGIFEGDYVIASTKISPRPGAIVIALVDGGSTVKRYELSRGKPLLKAENPHYKSIHPESELQIQGVVIGLFRWY